MWKDSWWLAKEEIKFQWPAFIMTLLATLVIALLAVSLLDAYARKTFYGEDIFFNRWLLDLIFIGLTPSFAALFMSGPYLSFRTIKEDPFSQRMAVYRSLPIPVDVLCRSRLLVMLITLLMMSTAFYVTLFMALPDMFYEQVTYQEFFIFMLMWFGYALALGGLNTYIEFGTNGKMLFLLPLISFIVMVLMFFLFYTITGTGIVAWSFTLVHNLGWTVVLISLLCGVLGCYSTNRLLKKRLLKRDYV